MGNMRAYLRMYVHIYGYRLGSIRALLKIKYVWKLGFPRIKNIRESYSFVIRQNWRNIREYIREYSHIFANIFTNIREFSRLFTNIRTIAFL